MLILIIKLSTSNQWVWKCSQGLRLGFNTVQRVKKDNFYFLLLNSNWKDTLIAQTINWVPLYAYLLHCSEDKTRLMYNIIIINETAKLCSLLLSSEDKLVKTAAACSYIMHTIYSTGGSPIITSTLFSYVFGGVERWSPCKHGRHALGEASQQIGKAIGIQQSCRTHKFPAQQQNINCELFTYCNNVRKPGQVLPCSIIFKSSQDSKI